MPQATAKELILSALVLLSTSVAAETVYLCKTYSGDKRFWSKSPCSQQQAAAERFYEVPSGKPFEEQVALAEQMRRAEARTQRAAPPAGAVGIQSSPVPGSEKECERQKERIKDLESMRHLVNPPVSRDGIAQELAFRRARVSELRCR